MSIGTNPQITQGGGGGSLSASDLPASSDVTISKGGGSVQPVFVDEVEGNFTGETQENTDVCGREETDNISNGGWQLTITGLIVKEQLDQFKSMKLVPNEPARIINDIHSGDYLIDDFTVTQKDGQVTWKDKDGTDRGLVFSFQIQTKAPDNEV